MPAGSEVMGKKGAIPDPEGLMHQLRPMLRDRWEYKPRSRNCEYFSIVACRIYDLTIVVIVEDVAQMQRLKTAIGT